MSDADALLRAIVRHPDDDTPRLVYADWLQENGRGEEAEFLRAQCRLAANGPADPEYAELSLREDELRAWLGTHGPRPRPTFPGGLAVEGGNRWWTYTHRGFPRFLEFDGYERHGTKAMRALANALERAFDALPARWLVLRFVTLAQLRTLLKQPVMAGLTQLTVQLSATGDEATDAARALAACRHLRNLRGLALAFANPDAACEALARGPWANLDWFSPTSYAIGPAGMRALAGADWFRNLSELLITDGLPDGTFDALARGPALSRLHTLDITQSAVPEDEWQAFARSRAFPALAKLTVSYGDMSGGRIGALADGAHAPRVLNLRSSGLSAGAGTALAAAPWIDGLTTLDLSNNDLPAADLRAFVASDALGALRALDLSGNALGPTALSALARNPALRDLRALHLSRHAIAGSAAGPGHYERFLARLDLPELRYLDLSGCPLGARAARQLTDPKFASLVRLHLNHCKLSDAAARAIITAPALRNLITLGLDGNKLTTGPEALADRAVLPRLAACGLAHNAIPGTVTRKLRRRPEVRL